MHSAFFLFNNAISWAIVKLLVLCSLLPYLDIRKWERVMDVSRSTPVLNCDSSTCSSTHISRLLQNIWKKSYRGVV